MTHARILATAAFAIATATGAAASPVDITFLAPSTSNGQTITMSNAQGDADGDSFPAYGFEMKVDEGGGVVFDILAWCLDLGANLGAQNTAEPYHITTTPFTNSFGVDAAQRARLQAMFDANYEDLDPSDGVEAAGFQVALWNTLYDGDTSVSSGPVGGPLSVTSSNGNVITSANGFLTDAVNYSHGKKFNLTFYQSTGIDDERRQNLVSVSPVPLPAALWMLAGALGGLGAFRKFRKV